LVYSVFYIEMISKSWGQTIRDRRRRLRLSQSQVAELSGKTQSQIARLEAGLDDPRLSTVVQVSRSLGTEIIPVPVRLLSAVRHLLESHDQSSAPSEIPRLVGNDPEDRLEDSDE
jgi:predicted transcriptional regulator